MRGIGYLGTQRECDRSTLANKYFIEPRQTWTLVSQYMAMIITRITLFCYESKIIRGEICCSAELVSFNSMWTSRHVNHDDVIKWKHFPRFWPFVRGIHRSTVNSPHKGQWRGALVLSLICAWVNTWVNNGEAGDFRRHRAHYDVIVKDCCITGLLWGEPAGHRWITLITARPKTGSNMQSLDFFLLLLVWIIC